MENQTQDSGGMQKVGEGDVAGESPVEAQTVTDSQQTTHADRVPEYGKPSHLNDGCGGKTESGFDKCELDDGDEEWGEFE